MPSEWVIIATATASTSATQSITATASIGISWPGSTSDDLLDLDVCYQEHSETIPNPNEIFPFNSPLSVTGSIATAGALIVPVSGTVVPGAAGLWDVGVCVRRYDTFTPDPILTYINGWLMVSN